MYSLRLCLSVVAVLCVLAPGATAEPARLTMFGGLSYGGDAQLHPALQTVACDRCTFMTRPTAKPEPPLASLGASIAGHSGRIRGGVEVFSLFNAATHNIYGYAGVVTFIGAQVGRAHAVFGAGFGTYLGGSHPGVYEALSGSTRVELGVRLARGWSLVARVDSLENEISTSRIGSVGLSLRPR